MRPTFRAGEYDPDPERDVQEEIGFHMEMKVEELMAEGFSREEAELPPELRPCHHDVAPRGAKTGTQGLDGPMERARIPPVFCRLLAHSIRLEMELESHPNLECFLCPKRGGA